MNGIYYILYCAPLGSEEWKACGLNAWEETPNESTLAYMSVKNIRYRIDKIRGDYNPYEKMDVIKSTIYEPDPALKEKYKNYFLQT